jgi:hypothetical protein
MSFVKRSAARSARFIVIGLLLTMVSGIALASRWESVTAFAGTVGSAFGLAPTGPTNAPVGAAAIPEPKTEPANLLVPLTGTRNIPGDYPDLAAAVTDLNVQGVGAGGVTFNLVAGTPQTAPLGGYVIGGTGSAVLASASAANPITFTGNSNTISAPAGQTAGNLNDAIFKLVGADWTTVKGFLMTENAANTTTAAATNNMTEWGVALLYVTVTDGAQNDTIQNNTIDLDRTYQNTFGIYSNSTHSATAVTTSATATGAAGGNENLKIYGNLIQDVNIGIVHVGPTAAADQNLSADIGGSVIANGNSIVNFGTTGTFSAYANVSGTVNGILVRNTKSFNISFNTVTSSNGGVTVGTLNGIQVPSSSVAPTGTLTQTIGNNTISLRSGLIAGAMNGINLPSTSVNATTTVNINNNDFNTFGHTVAGTGTISFIIQSGNPLAQNINNNTFTNMSVNTTGAITFVSFAPTMISGASFSLTGNSVVTGFTRTGVGATTVWSTNASSVAGSTHTVNNNNFSNITLTGASGFTGISDTDGPSGGGPVKNVNGNTFSSITTGAGTVVPISVNFSGANSNVNSNTVSSITTGSSITGLALGSSNLATLTATGNNINTLNSAGTTVTGLSVAGIGATVSKSKIYDLNGSAAGSVVTGIANAGATTSSTITLSNNLVGNLTAPLATSSNGVIGINLTSLATTSSFNVFYNTVYLNNPTSGAGFGSSGILAVASSTATSSTLNLRNNIIVNTSVQNGAGQTVAYRRSSGTAGALANYAATSNNNLFYAGTPGPSNLIYADGTSTAQTLANYKSGVFTAGTISPRDSNSVTENPPFLSTTGSSANFLHISTAVPTQIEGGATPIAGITDDFDGQTRNATTPDIGADEGLFILLDTQSPQITYAPLANTSSTANRIQTVTITDGTGVATGGNAPRIYFNKNGSGFVSTACALTGGTVQSGTWACTIDNAMIGGVAVTDIVRFFVVAQDTLGNLAANPSVGFSGTDVNTIATPPTAPNQYTIVQTFSGSLSVGTAETVTSLTNPGGLFEKINAGTLSGSLTVNITSDLTAETGTVALNQITEEGVGGYNVFIQASSPAPTIISGSNTGALINLNGADRVTFSGLTNGGHSLLIRNTSATTGAVVQYTNDASSNGILSCIIEGGNTSTSSALILLATGTTTGNDNNAITDSIIRDRTDAVGVPANAIASLNASTTARNTGNIISNNQITNFINNGFATSTGATSDNWTITNNDVSQNAARAGATFGFNTGGMAGTNVISGNKVHGFTSTGANAILGFLVGNSLNLTISNNKIYDFQTTAAATGVIEGIEYDGASGGAASLTVVNNMISFQPTVSTTQSVIGIQDFAFGGNTFNAFYNTVYIGGTAGAGAGASWAMKRGNAAPTTYTARNNLLFNNRTGGGANHYAGGDDSANTGTFVSTNNFYAGTGATAANFMDYGSASTGTPVTFAAWQAGPPARDAGSTGDIAANFIVTDIFVDAANNDLHLKATAPASIQNAGVPVAGITTDFDGETRSLTTPEIGADELAPPSGTVQFNSPTYSVGEGTPTVTLTVTRTGGSSGAATVNYALAGGTATGGAACTAGIDYINTGGSVNFADGDAADKTFNVTVCDDNIFEPGETFNATLSIGSGAATLGTPNPAAVTITDNDTVPSLQFSTATDSVSEGGGSVSVTVTRTGAVGNPVSVDYATASGTATGGAACTAGVDFINSSGTLNFGSGAITQTFGVTICNDNLFESNEAFTLGLSNPGGGAVIGSPSTETVTITENDTAPTFQFSSATYSTTEPLTGGFGSPGASINVTRTGATENAVSVNFATSNGTATGGATCTAGVDYINTSGTLNFPSGVTSLNFFVQTCFDTVFEGDETVNLTLSAPTAPAVLGAPNPAVLTIVENDTPPTLSFSSASFIDDESQQAGVTINRTGDISGTTTVTFTTTGGTATSGAACTAGVDFINSTGTITFNPNISAFVVPVQLCPDALNEPTETINLALSGPSAPAVLGAPSTAVLNINDTASQFRNTNPIAVTNGTTIAATPITVSGGPLQIGSVRVTLYDFQHNNSDDIDVLLVGPAGQKFVLMGDAGGANGLTTFSTITFDDGAGQVLPDNGVIATGKYEATNWVTPVTSFGAPAPAGPYVEPGNAVGGTPTLNGTYMGTNSNGVWNLYIRDDAGAFAPVGTGNVFGGWGLQVLAPSAAQGEISGRLLTAKGEGIRNASVTIQGGFLTAPVTVQSTTFGYYKFSGLAVGQTYVLTVNGKRYRFANPSRVINLQDSLTDEDFIANSQE